MHRPLNLPVLIALTVAAAVLGACGGSPQIRPAPKLPSLSGTITLENGGTVEAGAVLAVRLVDMSREDASRIVVEQITSNPGSFPIRFRLYYRDSAIKDTADYGVEASISEAGRTVWKQIESTPVLTKGRPQVVDLVLRRAP